MEVVLERAKAIKSSHSVVQVAKDKEGLTRSLTTLLSRQ